ncbi:MAG: hypothetical protein V7751_05360 [Pseudoalteromonas distincta]
MRVADIKRAQRSGPVLTLNIITHSGLGRYALQVCAPGSAPQLLIDARGLPRYWQSLAELRRALRRWGVGPVSPGVIPLVVVVPQDEVIGR